MQSQSTTPRRNCPECGATFFIGSRNRRYCSVECRKAAGDRLRPRAAWMISTDLSVSKATRGAISEMRAAADLMARGFHVFRAMSSSCPCDLVAWIPSGRVVRIEVKSAMTYPASGRVYRPVLTRNEFDVVCFVSEGGLTYEPPVEEW